MVEKHLGRKSERSQVRTWKRSDEKAGELEFIRL